MAEDIRQTVQNGVPLSEIAVLFRTNMQPRALMEYMVSANLAFQTKDRIPDIYEHWIARDFSLISASHREVTAGPISFLL